ncbi:hypothetical protein DFQ26_002098, partial [Actinomortierella ambigua]
NEKTSPDYLKRTVAHKNRQFNFTNYLTEYCTGYNFPKLGTSTDPTKPYHPWTAENIAIFSDGGCGSACATFAHQLEQKRGIKTVVVGGNNYTEKMSYASFPGGQVRTAEDQYYRVQRYLKTLNFGSANEGSQSESAVATPEQQQQQQQQQKQQQKPLSKREEEEGEAPITETAPPLREDEDGRFHSEVSIDQNQRDNLVKTLPETLQHRADFTFTWRQTYNTGSTLDVIVKNSAGEWVPNWGPDLGQWSEYSFRPATYRFPYTLDHFLAAQTLWESARDLVWAT